ncbi:MAG: bifunctional (p)ppGpp synthetase/guanosine-3',5'-bis(diphosphate) 3'-pyrophosphohydrolase [Myxococcaceae bacterium]|nr:bifunctional (p)ppGpp synthetase/guanosine-3',5'-bis(diphosphate) 3'-pyrophosphohydrolase [Myxococcaceae bacterium]MBH2006599.1 bifunctional (p)ppGpp synthetase/guanosine-3',5'-bis(diphosphate) 3'-pyrophosphohydrolase [Myxococcaceae bacterium]
MIRLSDIFEMIKNYHPTADLDLIQKAYVYSAKVHAGQVRKSGEPYLSHPMEVAKILAELKLDEASICTGLLHDTVEDTLATLEEIQTLFGKDIAHLVDGVTKLSQVQFKSTEEKMAENFRKMLVAMSKDIRVLLVKLADRLHNMRTLQYMKPEKQELIAEETLEIYAPLANRLGIGWIKVELEDLSFKYLKPLNYQELKEKIGKTKRERSRFIEEILTDIHRAMSGSGIQHFEISGRPKHLWSTYRKMVDKCLNFEDIHDLIAFRISVDSISQCYEALGAVHTIWKPVPGKFKDYIAMPKPNGYRSLHTTLIGSKGDRIEVQIRTFEMHQVAESGIAAHWKYKENFSQPVLATDAADRGFSWLTQLMSWQRELKDPNEFLDSVKVDLFSEEVYVFTPKGDVIELPQNATILDFAFAIHSDLGMHCVSARVNNQMAPLRQVLQSGDTCEIITHKNQLPNRSWLDYVKTSKARTKIRNLLKQQEREKSEAIGRELLEKEFRRYGTSLQKWAQHEGLQDFLSQDGLSALGYGKLEPRNIIQKIFPSEQLGQIRPDEPKSTLGRLIDRFSKKATTGIKVEGIEHILVHYARCCMPIKDDPVIGFVTRGRGLTIHRSNCQKIHELDQNRRIEVFWNNQVFTARPIYIRIITDHRGGMLASISMAFSKMNINILEANCRAMDNGQAINTFKCCVQDLEELKCVLKRLQSIRGVHSVTRSRSSTP